MKIRGKVLGVFNINDRMDLRDFSENDLYIARVIANQAAVAISAASLLVESIAAAEMQQSWKSPGKFRKV
jgi:GAF domain-containing protein